MKIVVCVKQVTSGELNPFDACALECALQIPDAEITLLSMGRTGVKGMLEQLTRLGNVNGVLLSDLAFAGADTLATGYALSLAAKKLDPDLIICGRQTVDGDTAQTGSVLATMMGFPVITNVMSIDALDEKGIACKTRLGDEKADLPALITVERINDLRRPSIRSKVKEVVVWTADDIGADKEKCGLKGSPTKVVKSFENESGKRKCKFIAPNELDDAVKAGLAKEPEAIKIEAATEKLKNVWIVTEAPRLMAETVSDDIKVIEKDTAENIAKQIQDGKPDVVLWPSDIWSRRTAPIVSAILETGLCADCTALETDGKDLFMYRPAFSGNVIAKIRCVTRPQMATVRTTLNDVAEVMLAAGKGVRESYDKVEKLAEKYHAELAASRGLVDIGFAPYEQQVGLTGKTVSPKVYIAAGISGAVHHIVGMQQAGTVIAINPEREAPIFEYADYGIIANIEDII
ncbi:MAG: FAD-binding protein [Clostridia bacterium]|nr:FAD-binding protein [Clostridia bacterium]